MKREDAMILKVLLDSCKKNPSCNSYSYHATLYFIDQLYDNGSLSSSHYHTLYSFLIK